MTLKSWPQEVQPNLARPFSRFVARFGKSYRPRIAALLALSVITGLLEIMGITLIFPLIALVNDPMMVEKSARWHKIYTLMGFHDPKTMVYFIAIMIGAVFIFKNVYMLFYQNVQLSIVKKWRDEICNNIMRQYMHASYLYHLKKSSGTMVNTLEFTVYFVLNSYVISLITLLSNLLVAAMLVTYVIIRFPVPTFISGTILTVLTIVQLKVIRSRSVKIASRIVAARAANLSALTQGLGAIKETKSFMKEKYFLNVYAATNAEISEQDQKSTFIQFIPTYVNEIVLVTTIIVLCCLVLAGNSGIVGIANLAILAAVAFRLAPLANRAYFAYSQVQVSTVAMQTLLADMIDLENAQVEILPAPDKILPFHHSIVLRDARFRYEDGKDALHDINLTIKKGEFIGIVGPSGAGKTTLVDVILGLLELDQGDVFVDDQHLSNERLPELRYISGYVSQSPAIFSGTVRDNVAFGIPAEQVDDQAVTAALKDASIDSFFRAKPDYLDEKIADNGKSLSGGQRQRLAIARALYKNPEIIILDEATSALDVETEYEIMRVINQLKGRKTIIAIAHRLSTLKECDRIIYMADARIVDTGTFNELNNRHPDFARMLKLSTVH